MTCGLALSRRLIGEKLEMGEVPHLAPENISTGAAPAGETLQRIVLTGFMGSGKSTVGRLLARQLLWRFVDADTEIEAAAGATVAEIFRTQGEVSFRELEHQTILRLLDSNQLVLALGGGAIEDIRTRRVLLQCPNTRMVHLEASLETVLQRCSGTEGLRPVLADRTHLAARYEQRLPLYRQSHLTLPVDKYTPQIIVQAVLTSLAISPKP